MSTVGFNIVYTIVGYSEMFKDDTGCVNVNKAYRVKSSSDKRFTGETNPFDALRYLTSNQFYSARQFSDLSVSEERKTLYRSTMLFLEDRITLGNITSRAFTHISNNAKERLICNTLDGSVISTNPFTVIRSDGRNVACIAEKQSSAASTTQKNTIACSLASQSASLTIAENSAAVSVGENAVAMANNYGSAAVTINDHSASTTKSTGSVALSLGVHSRSMTEGSSSVALSTGAKGYSEVRGERSVALSVTGSCSVAAAYDEKSIAIAVGTECKVMGVDGAILIIVEKAICGLNERTCTARVGENGIKPYTWYTLNKQGVFTEVPEDQSL